MPLLKKGVVELIGMVCVVEAASVTVTVDEDQLAVFGTEEVEIAEVGELFA